MTQKWFTAAELAEFDLPEMPGSGRGIQLKSERDGWSDPKREGAWWRKRGGRGQGIEYNIIALPMAARAALLLKLEPAKPRVVAVEQTTEDLHARWAWFEKQTDTKKKTAEHRLQVLHSVREMTNKGIAKVSAVEAMARETGDAVSTIYQWETLVHRVPRADWLPFLAPRHAGASGGRAECSDEAWEFFKADFLRFEQPRITDCYRRVKEAAAVHGWTVPSEKTLARRLADLPPGMVTLARQGREALQRMYPAQERSREALSAMQALNADFHKWDVFVRWKDGTVIRPQMMCLQDIYSGKILGYRFDIAPNKHAVRLCIGDVVETYGVPQSITLDNGREFASKWITGGTPTRFRFKVRDEEPAGLLVQLGVEVHWATPYHGQAKPIERAFRDLAGGAAKHPDFAGAYTGNTPMAKPENYGNSAVPYDVFLRRVAEAIKEHNARPGREGGVCAGRSFDEVFAASYAQAPVRKVSPDQRRLWLMAAESLRADRTDGSIRLDGNRYWSEALLPFAGQRVVVRFDPMALQADLHVYRADGAYLCAAPCKEAVGFSDKEAAITHGRNRAAFMRAEAEMLKAQRTLTPSQLSAMLPSETAPAPIPEPRVVRLITGNTVRQVEPELHEQSEAEKAMVRAWAQQHRGPRLVTDFGDE